MDTLFWYKLGLSFVVGGVWITITTVVAEKLGSRVGGLIGGLPSTVVVALFFIGLTQTVSIASEATTVIPLVQGCNGLFIIVYLVGAKRNFLTGIVGALLFWLVMMSLILLIEIRSFSLSLVVWLVLLLTAVFITEKRLKIPAVGRISVSYAPAYLLMRSIFGGSAIASAVLLAKVGGPYWGGIFAAFPAVFMSSIIITWRSGGLQFSQAVAKSMMVSGVINVAVFAAVVRYTFLWFGLLGGTLVALLVSLVSGYATYCIMKREMS